MSTRSYIVRENSDGTYTGIYCHCDRYPTYNGAMLLDHYATRDRVDRLLSFGHLSILGEKIEPDPSLPHSFDDRQEGVCVFYGRDRGEEHQHVLKVDLKEIDKSESWVDYCYVFGKDGTWRYFKCGELDKGLQGLQKGLDEEFHHMGFPRPKGYYGIYTEDDIERRAEEYKREYGMDMEM